MNQVMAQEIGFFGLIFIVLSFQNKNRKLILLFLTFGQFIMTFHYGLLQAWTAVAINFVSALRTYVFYKKETQEWANNKFWLYGFIGLLWVLGLITREGWYGWLPILATSMDSLAQWQDKSKKIRLMMLIPRPLWFSYNYIVHSYPGMMIETLVVTSIILGIIRFDLLKKNNQGR